MKKQDKKDKVLRFTWERKILNVEDLIPYELNNKIHKEKKVNLLANIIGKFWYIDEMIVDKNNILIAGHGRLDSIKKMWYEQVEVKVLDLDSKDAGQLRLFHNKIQEFETDNNGQNIRLEIEALWEEALVYGMDVSLAELYPEYDNPEIALGEESKDKSFWNREVDPDDLYKEKNTHTCPKCGFEFIKESDEV